MKELADSILEVGLINPIMVDQAHTLIAGLHRLEAMKLLGRTKIECTMTPSTQLLFPTYPRCSLITCKSGLTRSRPLSVIY